MGKELLQGINALAKAARRGKGTAYRIPRRGPSTLGSDEILIAVADADSVAVERVRIPAPKGRTPPRRTSKPEEIARRLAEIELIADEIAEPAPLLATPPALSRAEEQLLRDAGLDPTPLEPDEMEPLHRATAEYARLVHDSFRVDQAAKLLRVNPSRIRQRLTGPPRTLYGITIGGTWRIPRFQFQGQDLIPGIDRVVQGLPEDLHPVTVYRWLTTPSPDLTLDDDTPVSPLDWLRLGNPPETVAELASCL